jgi:YHS domain-containing protein
MLSAEQFASALSRRRARIGRVCFKQNRAQIIALGKDGRTLHIHACFQTAPDDVLDAVAAFLKASRRSQEYRAAIRRVREYWQWQGEQAGWLIEEDSSVLQSVRELACSGTREQREFLREAYARFNLLYFHNRLPADFPLRISERMASRFGHMRYHVTRSGQRVVLELAVNQNLFIAGNEANLLDTLLHEMTHVEAWLEHGHRGHGAIWKRIARRVGCEALACSARVIRRRRRGALFPRQFCPRESQPVALPVRPGVYVTQRRRHMQQRDPVCGMTVDSKTAAAESVQGNEHFYFCSLSCRDRFEANPTQFTSASRSRASGEVEMERHEPPRTTVDGITSPKFGAAGSGGAEYESIPEHHKEGRKKDKR